MVSGMRINMIKSELYGIDMSPYDLEASCQFLGCKIEHFPCNFWA